MQRDRNYYISLDNMERLDIRLPIDIIKQIEHIVSTETVDVDEFLYGSLNHFILIAVIKEIRKYKTKPKHLNNILSKKHTKSNNIIR